MVKIRLSRDRLVINMVIPYMEKTVFILRRGAVSRYAAHIPSHLFNISTAMLLIYGV